MRLFLIALFAVFAGFWWIRRPVIHPAGVLVRQEPIQVLSSGERATVTRAGFTLRPLAGYIIEGRVLHTKRYFSDPISKLVPYDVGLGWGKMSDTSVLEQLELSQSNRFLFWHWSNHPPLPTHEIETHASNNHLIAADDSIARQIAWLRVGEIIRLEGSLIETDGPLGQWRSSLSRNDTGNGACEVMWVSKLTKLPMTP